MPADLTQDILNSDVITLLTRAIPNPELIVDENLNDSYKTLTVDSAEIWHILWIWVEFTATATVGNRNMRIIIRDDSDDRIYQYNSNTNQAASDNWTYLFTSQLVHSNLGGIPSIHIPIPAKLYLPAGYDIDIGDGNNVDAAADDMIIQMMVNRYDV